LSRVGGDKARSTCEVGVYFSRYGRPHYPQVWAVGGVGRSHVDAGQPGLTGWCFSDLNWCFFFCNSSPVFFALVVFASSPLCFCNGFGRCFIASVGW
jgi:hypothetical protein